MLATLMILAVSAQGQGPMAWQEGPAATAFEVKGETELSPAAAMNSAEMAAREFCQGAWQDRAAALAGSWQAAWMPAFLAREIVRRAMREVDPGHVFTVVDRRDRVREHEFGNSYQTSLWLAPDHRRTAQAEQRLRSALRRGERTTLLKLGGTAALWGLLAFLGMWLDRLSRGYMTGRLWLLGILLGGAVPLTLFLV